MIKIIGRMLALSGRRRSKLILSFFVNFLESIMGFVPVVVAYLSFSWLQADAMSTGRIRLIAVALAAAVLLRYAFKLLEFNLQSGVGYEVMCDERLSLGKRLLRLSLGFYQDSDAGRISSILNDDLVFIEDTATAFISKTVGAIFGAIGMAAFMFVTDWRVALVACVGYPLAGIANHFIKRHMTACSALRQQAHAEASSAMLEHLRGIFVIKTFGLDGAQGTRLRRALRNLEVVSCDLEMGALPLTFAYTCCFNVCTAVILGSVATFYLGSTMTLSSALLFIILLFAFYAPMELLGASSGILRLMNACLDRAQGIMERPVMDEGRECEEPRGYGISFSGVAFSYGGNAVLDRVSFAAPQNTMTAIVGPSGSGKSTILGLIARFWDVEAGSVEIDGMDVRHMTRDQLARHISIVFQETYLFHDTVADNIRLGRPDATDEMVIEAAKRARCHEFVSQLSHGYETMLSEAGATLSAGERQRIAIARALLKDAPIVLLDEVTAHIDPENELLIQQAIDELVKGRTMIIVTHKLSTIRYADRIIVLDGRKGVAESGTHDELMGNDGLYAAMWAKSQRIGSWQLCG